MEPVLYRAGSRMPLHTGIRTRRIGVAFVTATLASVNDRISDVLMGSLHSADQGLSVRLHRGCA